MTINSRLLVQVDLAQVTREVLSDLETHIEQIGFDEKYLDPILQVFQRLHGRGEYQGTLSG
jgi:light-regulated signal transduction histidine kinase (bacteriophytochrome)